MRFRENRLSEFEIALIFISSLYFLGCGEEPLQLATLPIDTDSDTDTEEDDSETGMIIIGGKDSDTVPAMELGPPVVMDCSECDPIGNTPESMICALDICNEVFVVDNTLDALSPLDTDLCLLEEMYASVERFGDADNELLPRLNDSYTLLGSGKVLEEMNTNMSACTDLENPGSLVLDQYGDSSWIFDAMEWKITMIAPPGAEAFSFKYVFFSAEYDEYISSPFNDKFYVILNAPKTTNGEDRVINYTDCRDPGNYYDFKGSTCDTPSGYCCYIAINSALSDCCWYPYQSEFSEDFLKDACPGGVDGNTDISGTGFECASASAADSPLNGSSTGWLLTAWPIVAGETFTITFHVHDTNDANWDSLVLLDAFQFHGESRNFGTVPID